MSKSLSLATGAAFLFAVGLAAAPQDSAMPAAQSAPKKDTRPASAQTAPAADEFLKKVSQSNRAEIELGQLAQTKSSNEQVKTFARMLVDDHTKSHAAAAAIAQTKKVTLPMDLTAAQMAQKQQFDSLSGAAFDRAYANQMVTNHQNGIRDFEAAAKSTDAEVRAFAEKTLPTLRHHLSEAQKLQAAVK
jgi:putative membrane protein